MCALFGDPAIFQHHDPVHRGDGGQAVRDGDHRLALHHAAQRLLEDALILQDAGCFSLVLESVPARLAQLISQRLEIPTIGVLNGAYQRQVLNVVLAKGLNLKLFEDVFRFRNFIGII